MSRAKSPAGPATLGCSRFGIHAESRAGTVIEKTRVEVVWRGLSVCGSRMTQEQSQWVRKGMTGPLTVVVETWESRDMGIILLQKNSDPRSEKLHKANDEPEADRARRCALSGANGLHHQRPIGPEKRGLTGDVGPWYPSYRFGRCH